MYEETVRSLKDIIAGSEPGRFTAQFVFDAALPVFRGHFPGMPLLPGVMQIEMARHACERFIGRPCRLVRVVKAKFMGKVRPGEFVHLEGATADRNGYWRLKATLRVNATVVAALTLVLAEDVRSQASQVSR